MVANNWQLLGCSVRGIQHNQRNLPNQDAIGWLTAPRIMAIADGHGSLRSFRSQEGAQLAVQVALTTLEKLAVYDPHHPDLLTQLKRQAIDKIPYTLVEHWRIAVEQHIQNNPFSSEECKQLTGMDSLLAYGTTLLTVLITQAFIVCWQLGDGDILIVWRDGQVEHPIPPDERLLANATTSLCTKNAWRDFRYHLQPLVNAPPDLILLCTDGYTNSFAENTGLQQAGWDFLQLLDTEGSQMVDKHLPNWLAETSQAGSGDDTTVGLLYREK